MKSINLILSAILFITINFPLTVSAQLPNEVFEPYWVIKGNVKNTKYNVVYFYNAEHQLMYKEIIDGRKINIKNPKVRHQLNAALADVLTAQNQDKLLSAEILIVRNRLKINKNFNQIPN